MKTIRQSTLSELLLHLEGFYDSISYDGSPEFEHYTLKGVWITLLHNSDVAGFINLEPLNNVMWNCHVMIHPSFRKNGSEEWGILTAEFMREHCGAKKFLALTPYIAAKKYAEKIGFKHVHTLNESVQKNGILIDQYMLEMN